MTLCHMSTTTPPGPRGAALPEHAPEHPPPHVHVVSRGQLAVVANETGALLQGQLCDLR